MREKEHIPTDRKSAFPSRAVPNHKCLKKIESA